MTLDEIQKIALIQKNSAKNFNYLLGNLPEWSRIQHGVITFLPKTLPLKTFIEESLILNSEAAKEKRIEIKNQIPDNLTVNADKNTLETIIRNLVSSAIKFTQHGGNITISAAMPRKNWVEISIQDNGIGMEKEILENLFKPDARVSRKATDGELSTGLGLIICKDLIDKHNGKFWAESQAG
jgi:two-component system, sensor histidine kinase and response regulator